MGKPLTTDEWVRRLNDLSREMDALAATLHPSMWSQDESSLPALNKRWRKLAAQPTLDVKQLDLPLQVELEQKGE